MGWFSSKTKYYVSSSVYNLMGDNEYQKFLKTTVIHAVLGGTPIGETITDSLLQGSGIRMRSFLRWANSDYGGYRDYMGVAESVYYDVSALSNQEAQDWLQTQYSLADNQSIQVETAYMGEWNEFNYADYIVWNKFPQYIGTEYYVFTQARYVSGSFSRVNYDVYLTIHTTDDENSTPFYEEKVWSYQKRTRSNTDSDGNTTYSYEYYYTYEPIDPNKQFVYILFYINTRTEEEITNEDGSTTTITHISSEPKAYFYQQGGEETYFEDMFGTATPLEYTYAPYIPVRIDNAFLDKNSEGYTLAKKACKKAMGSNCYQEIVDAVGDNDSIGDIDYTYMHFGASLNTPYEIGKDYIFRIIRNLYEAIQTKNDVQVHIWANSNKSGCQFNIWLEWASIKHSFNQGLATTDAEEDHYYFSWYNERINTGEDSEGNPTYTTKEHTILRYQEASNRYEEFDLTDFAYANLIYHGKSVVYSGGDALSETDEDSGFIIPLQINTYKEMNLIDATDLTQMCNYLIFNCWVKKKQKWYQSGFFSFLITVVVVVVAVVITIWSGGSASGAAGAAVGSTASTSTAASIGAFFGLTGTAAIAVGTFVIAAMGAIVANVVAALASKLTGNTFLGSIIGTIAGIIFSYGINSIGSMEGFSVSSAFGSLTSAPNLLKLGLGTLNAVSEYMQAAAQETMKALGKLQEEYTSTMEKISDLYKQNLSSSGFDPLFFTSAMNMNPMENRSSYLTRTLMTGTDIAQMSINMIKDFPSLSRTLA